METLKGIGAELRGINLKARQKGGISSTSHFRFAKGSQKWSLTNKVCYISMNSNAPFYSLQIYSMAGQLIQSQTRDRNPVVLDLKKNGMYFYWLNDSNGNIAKEKFIVEK